jgi:glutamyl-tRNA reductase
VPFVVGLNHRTAPVEVREKLAVAPAKLHEMLHHLKKESQSEELVCLSTCNRMEVYADAKNPSQARSALERVFQTLAGAAGLSANLYYHENEEAVRHLFTVAAGLDSMVQGEHEILAQVKEAYQTAHKGGFTGKLLNVLFQRSLYVGKRVRTQTGLGVGAASVGSVAVGMAERIFGSLRDRRIMILGAGKMAEVTAKHLLAQKAPSLFVANRTFERACELAKAFGGTAMHFEEGLRQMAEVDIVICSTAAPHSVITPEHVRRIMEKRKGRSLFLIDIAVPRDVDPAVNNIENVYLYNIDDLQQIVSTNRARRTKEAEAASRIVQEETHEFARWLRAGRMGLRTGLKHTDQADPSPNSE